MRFTTFLGIAEAPLRARQGAAGWPGSREFRASPP